MPNATMVNPFPYLICASGDAIFCSEKEMTSGIFVFHSFPLSSTLSSRRWSANHALSPGISGVTPATGHSWGLLRVVSVSSCSWYRLHPTQGTSESCQSRVLGTDSDSQTQTMILLKLCSGWKPCSTFSQHPQLLLITGFATMLLSTKSFWMITYYRTYRTWFNYPVCVWGKQGMGHRSRIFHVRQIPKQPANRRTLRMLSRLDTSIEST